MLARGFLERAGWTFSTLAPESTLQRRHALHTDKTLVWSRPDSALPARVRVAVTLAGDTVTRLTSSLEFGSDARARRERQLRIQESGSALVILPMLAAGLAVVARKRWRRRAQWDAAGRLALLSAVALTMALRGALVADPWLEDPSFDPQASAVGVTARVFAVALFGAALTTVLILLFAGTASVAAASTMPSLLRGFRLIAVPERRLLAPALLAGACYGLLAQTAAVGIELLSRTLTRGEIAVYVSAIHLPSVAAALMEGLRFGDVLR